MNRKTRLPIQQRLFAGPTPEPKAAENIGRIQLYEDIGCWGVNAAWLRNQLAALGDVDTVELYIHSRGGSVFEAFPMAAMLAKHPAKVNAIIEGVALSAASYIPAAACDHVSISASGMMMMHDAWASTQGNVAEHQAAIDLLAKIQPILVDAYAARMTWKRAEVVEAMGKDLGAGTWFNAAEALAAGLVDEVVDLKSPPNAAVDLSGFRGVPDEALARFSGNGKPDSPEEVLAAELLEFLEHQTHQPYPKSAGPDAETLALLDDLLTN